MLCEPCQRIIHDAESNPKADVSSDQYVHHESRDSLLVAARQKCYICWLTAKEWANTLHDGTKELKTLSFWQRNVSTGSIDIDIAMQIKDEWKVPTHFQIDVCKTGGDGQSFSGVCDISQSSLLASSTGNPEVISLVKEWLDTCLADHDLCKAAGDGSEPCYPNRLIDTLPRDLSGDSWRLIELEDNAVQGPYVTLSHRWGSTHQMTLNTETYSQMKQGMSCSSLPPNYKDAVMVARSLGVRYLWIDSICIFQDKALDIQLTASAMADVYSNAICNIAALTGLAEGIFSQRDPELIGAHAMLLHRNQYQFENCYAIRSASDILEVDKMPLSLRGWVAQERVLAKRTILFGSSKLYWECPPGQTSENNTEHTAAPYRARLIAGHGAFSTLRAVLRDYSLVHSTDVFPHLMTKYYGLRPTHHKYALWMEFIEIYTRCDLTEGEDMLLAIAGIAEVLSRYMSDTYVAGLWSGDLVRQLLWNRQEQSPLVDMPPRYRAPSWSWAAVDSPINFSSRLHQRPMTQVVHCALTHKLSTPRGVFGMLDNASITLRGRILGIAYSSEWNSKPYTKSLLIANLDRAIPHGEFFSTMSSVDTREALDQDPQQMGGLILEAWCIQRPGVEMEYEVNVKGLIIFREEFKPHHRRIGMFTLSDRTDQYPVRFGWLPSDWNDMFILNDERPFDVDNVKGITEVTIV